MKKFLVITLLLFVAACSHKPESFGDTVCASGSSGGKCHYVRVIYPVTRQKGIYREESSFLSACDRNTEFYTARKIGTLNDEFFWGANERSCGAMLCPRMFYY